MSTQAIPECAPIGMIEVMPTEMATVAAKPTAAGAVSSVVFGIIGFPVMGLILGIIAIKQAEAAKRVIEEDPNDYSGSGLANIGMTLGIIDVVAWTIGIVLLGAGS